MQYKEFMKHVLFTYISLAAVVLSAGSVHAQQKANYQLAEKFRLLEKNPVSKYSTEIRPTFIILSRHVRGRSIIMSIRKRKKENYCLIMRNY